jgi:arylformamidase
MKITFKILEKPYIADTRNPLDIFTPVRFDGGAAAFDAAPARKSAFRSGSFVGDVREGGSCNCELYTFSPHLHGTHTECVGHIAKNRIAVTDIIGETLVPATLITVKPEKTGDSYDPPLAKADLAITRAALEKALKKADRNFLTALVIRTRSRDFKNPPFFSTEAMTYISGLPVLHLLTDLPSIDRRDDGGKLSNHRIFWGVKPGVTAIKRPSPRTITELIAAPKAVPDGHYLLDLQVAPFLCDAAPSRPVLYRLREARR